MNHNLRRAFCWVLLVFNGLVFNGLVFNGHGAAAQELDDPSIGLKVDEDKLRANRIRKITGKHLTLFTDLPSSKEVDELAKVFDAAVSDWQTYFGKGNEGSFHATGFLMKDRNVFVRAGVVPNSLPDFKNGYTYGKRTFWMYEQPSSYMRRQLMIHEGTHAFLFSHFGTNIPSWFNEGLAELFACHQWSDGKLKTRVTIQNRDAAPFWGRTKLIREKISAGEIPTIDEIRNLSSQSFLRVDPYAWVWAISAFLDNHPEYGPKFRKLPAAISKSGQVDKAFDEIFAESRTAMNDQWRAYLSDIDYGVNSENSQVDFQEAKTERDVLRVISAQKSWQNSGIDVSAGKSYLIRSKGRFVIRKSTVDGRLTDWPCEPNGVTLVYHRGQPLGKLVLVLKPNDPKQPTDFFKPVPIGLSGVFKAPFDGTLFFRVNESPADLHDNSGQFLISVVEHTPSK